MVRSPTERSKRARQVIRFLAHLLSTNPTAHTACNDIIVALQGGIIAVKVLAERDDEVPGEEQWPDSWNRGGTFKTWAKGHLSKWLSDLTHQEKAKVREELHKENAGSGRASQSPGLSTASKSPPLPANPPVSSRVDDINAQTAKIAAQSTPQTTAAQPTFAQTGHGAQPQASSMENVQSAVRELEISVPPGTSSAWINPSTSDQNVTDWLQTTPQASRDSVLITPEFWAWCRMRHRAKRVRAAQDDQVDRT
ncbi:hypothetical protein ACHAPU_008067 [Fusarium lateritium]